MGMQTAPAQLFYDFCLDDHVPGDHLLRRIDRFPDLEKVRTELKPFYSSIGRPSIDPELMMRMLIVGYFPDNVIFTLVPCQRNGFDCSRSRAAPPCLVFVR